MQAPLEARPEAQLQARLQAEDYDIGELAALRCPRLAVYRTRLDQNVSLLGRYIESVVPGSSFRHLTPHVKTHKSAWVTRRLLSSGVRRFKCTLNELDMLLEAGAEDIFVAYPLLGPDAVRVAERIAAHPGRRIAAQVGSPIHAAILAEAARSRGVEVDCLVDLNVGQDRTGVTPEAATDVVRAVVATGALRFRGLHAYAGHNVGAVEAERVACARTSMERVASAARELLVLGVRPERIVVAGTPSFREDLHELVVRHRVDAEVEVSPGTWTYWDGDSERRTPGLFEFAALIVAQVIDRPAPHLATLNVGSKRWGVDRGPLEIFSLPGLEVRSVSEEHTVVHVPGGTRVEIGDVILAAPQHVCTTVNLWESFTIVGEDGRVEHPSEPVTARNR